MRTVNQLIVGDYRLIREIGRGGMGAIYEAEGIRFGHRYAVKVSHERYCEDTYSITRFYQETAVLAALSHPHIVQVYDYGQDSSSGRVYSVMELLQGETLADTLMRGRTLHLSRGLRIARQIASALGAVHGLGIVHRDVKPDNIHLQRRQSRPGIICNHNDREPCYTVNPGNGSDLVTLLDLGIAKFPGLLDNPEETFGTPLYMAPEQITGRLVDARTDIYGLGVLLFEMLVGEPPFLADCSEDVELLHLREPPPIPSLMRPDIRFPTSIDELILRALSKDPSHRQQSAREFCEEVDQCLSPYSNPEAGSYGSGE